MGYRGIGYNQFIETKIPKGGIPTEKRGVLIAYAPCNNTPTSATYLNIFRIGGWVFRENKK